MKSLNLIAVFILFALKANSQNLIPNGDFEQAQQCSGGKKPDLWYSPILGTPDYYGINDTGNCSTPTPPTLWQGATFPPFPGFQMPYSNDHFVGIGIAVNTREYAAIRLYDTLKPNQLYYLEFYVSLAENSGRSTDGLGIALDTDSIYDYTQSFTPIPGLQFVAGNPVGNNLNDTLNWMFVKDTFVATGGEQFLILGNIRPDGQTNFFIAPGNSTSAYYYLDDISLIEIKPCQPGNDTTICWNDSLQLGVSPLANTVYSWQPVSGLSDPAIANPKALPSVTTTYTLTQTQLGITSSAQVTVTIDTICDTLDFPEILIYPNPSNGHFEIQGTFPANTYLEIFNMLGQRVWLIKINPGETKQEINLPLTAGAYGYRISSHELILKNGKIVNEK